MAHLRLLVVDRSQEVLFHRLERIKKEIAVLLGDAGKRFLAGDSADRANLSKNRSGVRREKQLPSSAVGRVRTPLDHPGKLKAIKNSHKGDRLDVQELGKAALLDALMTRQIGKHLPLRPRESELAGAMLEALAHEARHVVQKKA
jgi:hypothetical protein